MMIAGAVLTVFCVAQLFNPVLMRVEDREWLESLAVAAPGLRLRQVPAPPLEPGPTSQREKPLLTEGGKTTG